MKTNKKNKFYSLDRILKTNSTYNVIFGERSNGKTFSVLDYGLKQYCKNGSEMAIIRRMEQDVKGSKASSVFNGIVEAGKVLEYTNGEYNSIYYYSGKWFLCNVDENTGKRENSAERPFAYSFTLSAMEHFKSTSFPNVRTILFDEFMTRGYYLPDEFVLFMNTLSTIIRLRDDVLIFMLGNTVNKYCPYFEEMGLTRAKKMLPGDLDVYNYGDSTLKVAVEYTEPMAKENKKSNKYFAFENPKLKMITGGAWEIDIYPHLPYKYKPKEVIFRFYILFDGESLEGEVINSNTSIFIYLHRKTTPLQYNPNDLIYQTDFSPYPNIRRNILRPYSIAEKKIYELFANDKVFYQSNDIGEIVRNYLKWCKK